MKKLIALFFLALTPVAGFAAGGAGVHLESADIDLGDKAALQRGAKWYTNYCLGCHSLEYFRYEKLKEFGLTEEEIKANLMPADAKIGDQVQIAMPEEDAANWFGAAPPDLTLTVRLKHGGADWIYSYLKSFYIDESRPLGVNNTVFPDVGMPHVMWDLQGLQRAVFKEEVGDDGKPHKVFERFELASPGQLSAEEYDEVARDIATFLTYVSEPVKQERERLGVFVILFLVVFTVLAYLMKKEYWKDVH